MPDDLFSGALPVGQLSVDDEAFLVFKADQIRAVATSAVIEIGRHLIEAKGRVGHGNFLAWVDAEFGWSERSAYNYMGVAERFPNLQALANGEITREALYLLAGPTVPEAAREEAVERAEAGDRITKEEAERMIAERAKAIIEETVADFRAKQASEVAALVETKAGALRDDLADAEDEIAKLKRAGKQPLDVEGLCKAVEKNLKVKRMSPAQYQLLAQLLGVRISVGKVGYDPVSQERIAHDTESLKITSQITEALAILAGAPSPDAVASAAWPIQRKQHLRTCQTVLDWLVAYKAILESGGKNGEAAVS